MGNDGAPRERGQGTHGKETEDARKRDVQKAKIDGGALSARCFGEPRGDFAARAIFAMDRGRICRRALPTVI